MKQYSQFKKRILRDKKVKKGYDALEVEFKLVELLIAERLKRGVSQKELAYRIGTKQSAIARFESGNCNPTLSFIRKISGALNVQLKIKASSF